MEFKNEKVIIDNNQFINIGKINDEIVIIFSDSQIQNIKLNFNDKNNCSKTINHNGSNINIYYPCEEHNNFPKKSKYIILNETPEEYKNKILPYINGIYKTNTKWIKNIIYNNSEQEKIFFKNDDIVIIKNITWKEDKCKDSFYILAIPVENLMTIRDLRKKHIPILLRMKEECIKVAEQYDINKNQLYFFFHYHPSFYHLHLHCCIINNKELSTKYFRCKMLETIIMNLIRNSHFYKNNDIMFEIPDSHIISRILSKNS